MKLQVTNKNREQGTTVLLVSLMVTVIMGITLASYLVMIQTQNRSVFRSQNWNNAIAITEAGVEEGLTHLNAVASVPGDLATDGWTDQGGGVYACPRRYLGSNYYDLTITVPANGKPMVDAVGTVSLLGPFAYAPQTMFAAAGVTSPQQQSLARKVEAKTRVDGLLTVVMAAIQQIDFSGKNVATDSFDSSDPAYSTGGLYDPTKTKDHGDVCTDYTIINSLLVGNAQIKGTVRTGALGTVAIGPNGSVGDKAWVEGGSTGIETGHCYDDFNVSFPPVKLPASATTWLPPASSSFNMGGVSYSYALNGGDYKMQQINGPIYITGPTRIYVTDKINLTGSSDQIRIASTNKASLVIYMGGSTTSISGVGVVNESGLAINFEYLGLPSNSSASFGGNATFVGCIYCPSAALSLGGGGNNTYDFVGASVSYTVKMNGHFNFHYDESLLQSGPSRGYIVTSWREL